MHVNNVLLQRACDIQKISPIYLFAAMRSRIFRRLWTIVRGFRRICCMMKITCFMKRLKRALNFGNGCMGKRAAVKKMTVEC